MAKSTKATPVTIDRALVKQIRAELEAAAQKVAAKYGMTVLCTGASFNSKMITPKLTLTLVDDSGVTALDKDAANAFSVFGPSKGLQAKWLGATFSTGRGEEYKITGLDLKRPKNCVILMRLKDGTKATCSAQSLIAYMKG